MYFTHKRLLLALCFRWTTSEKMEMDYPCYSSLAPSVRVLKQLGH